MAGIAQAAAFDRASQQIRATDSRMGGMVPLSVLVVNAVVPNQGSQPTETEKELQVLLGWLVRNPVTNSDGSLRTADIFLKGIPVGRSAQTTSALGVNFDIDSETSLGFDMNYYDRYYSNFNLQSRSTAETLAVEPWRVPSYILTDVIFRHGFKIGDLDASITGRVYNLFNEEFINRSDESLQPIEGTNPTQFVSDASGAQVFFGQGRTFSISTRINF